MNESPFVLEAQNGIFTFFFALIDEYAKTMSRDEAFQKATDWIESFTQSLRTKYAEMQNDVNNKMKEHKTG